MESAVNARLQKDENPNSSIVAEAMKLLANRYYVINFQAVVVFVTKNMNNEKTDAAINRTS